MEVSEIRGSFLGSLFQAGDYFGGPLNCVHTNIVLRIWGSGPHVFKVFFAPPSQVAVG